MSGYSKDDPIATGQATNPVDIDQEIVQTRRYMHEGVDVISARKKAKDDTKAAYDKAFARAFIAAPCAQTEKRYHAELATTEERTAMEVADRAYWYAKDRADVYASELMALQGQRNTARRLYGGT